MASPPKRGRPKDEIGFARIKLKKDVHEMWLARKTFLGFSSKTRSDFARYLLLNFPEDRPQKSFPRPSQSVGSPNLGKRSILMISQLNKLKNVELFPGQANVY